ncbi:methyltransferase family protein [Kribbella rubisoli]|uniref:Methyltransferase family protein n=1 Tax=Kribbella rubisoli TaxID=3075929 RepID=A0A4Q7X5J6_9ACTN|nr:methyltransferase domain-containing protein [Kribbella rubisoli]RZU18384.1 methyltransferase family protein [Kribbella rubisoli]
MTDRLSRLARSWDEAAEGYDEYFVPRFAPWVQAAVDALHTIPFGMVLVPCCGTFPELELLAPRFPDRRIVGLDLSAEMVRLATRRAADLAGADLGAGGRSLVEVVQGDAATLDPGWSAAAVVSVFGLQQLPDPAAAIRSWYDALLPGGRLCVVYWPEFAEEAGPFALLDEVMDGRRDRSWEDALVPALDGAVIERDELVSFQMVHPSAAAYFDAANHAGPLRATALARGDDYIAELRARYLAAAPAGEWRHEPWARLISATKPLSRAGEAPPTS